MIDVSDDEPMVRRLGEEHEDVAIIIDSGADVALFSLSMAGHGEGEFEFSTKTKLQDVRGNHIPQGVRSSSQRECGLQFKSESAHTLLWKADGTWLGNHWSRADIGDGDLKVPLNWQNRPFDSASSR